MANKLHQMVTDAVRPDSLLVVVGGRQCVGSGVARVMALIPVTTKSDAVKAMSDDDKNGRMWWLRMGRWTNGRIMRHIFRSA